MAKPQATPLSYRWHILQRLVAAVLLGYALSASLSALLAQILPLAQVEAVAIASMLSFTLYTMVIIGCFVVRRLTTLWIVLLGGVLISTGLSYLISNPTVFNIGAGA